MEMLVEVDPLQMSTYIYEEQVVILDSDASSDDENQLADTSNLLAIRYLLQYRLRFQHQHHHLSIPGVTLIGNKWNR